MRIRLLDLSIPILITSFALVGCDTSTESSTPSNVPAGLNTPFTLSVGQTGLLNAEHLSVTFLGVPSDTRCPVDIVCMQAGDATLSIRAEKGGKPGVNLAIALSDDPQTAMFEGYAIDARRLLPDQMTGRTIPAGEYTVTLVVNRP